MSGVTVVARYKREPISPALAQELQPLLTKHWHEISHYPDILLNVDWPHYFKMEEAGILRVYTARLQTGELIGYAAFVLRYNPHYADSKTALQDVLFIDPAKRGFGKHFILWCDEELKKEEVQLVIHHVKQAHNFGPMLESMGYELIDLIYGRRLDLEHASVDAAGRDAARSVTGRAE